MYSRGASFVIVLIALALVGGAVVVGNYPTTPPSPPWKGGEVQTAVVVSARDKKALADIERQIGAKGNF